MVGPEAACSRVSKLPDNLTVTLSLEGKRGFDSIICSYSGMNSERGTISYFIKRVVKDGLWKNLFLMKQNESLNPVLLTLPPEITALLRQSPGDKKKIKGGKVSNSGMNCGSFRAMKGLPSITKYHFCQGLCYTRCSCPSSGPLSL